MEVRQSRFQVGEGLKRSVETVLADTLELAIQENEDLRLRVERLQAEVEVLRHERRVASDLGSNSEEAAYKDLACRPRPLSLGNDSDSVSSRRIGGAHL